MGMKRKDEGEGGNEENLRVGEERDEDCNIHVLESFWVYMYNGPAITVRLQREGGKREGGWKGG